MNTYQTRLLKRLALAGLIGLFSSAALADHHAEGDEEMKQEQVMPEDSGVDSSNDSAMAKDEDGAVPGGEIVKDGGVDSNHAPNDDASASDSQSALDEGDLVEDSGVDSANEPENDV